MKKYICHEPWIALLLLPFCFEAAVRAQSLWQEGTARPMFADRRACAVGDILTVTVAENSSAAKNNGTQTEKSSSWVAAVTTFLFPGIGSLGSQVMSSGANYKGTMPAMDYTSDIKHSGSGTINNSETIVAQVAVKVMDVLPNHNLVVEGKRETSFAGERQTITLHGIVRPEDISPTNSISSVNVADATIQIVGRGTVTDSTSKGWFTRVVDKLNPF